MKLYILVLVFIFAASCSTTCNKTNEVAKNIDTFKTKSASLLKLIENNKADKGHVIARAQELIEISKPILKGFQIKYPQCQKYLQQVLDNSKTMQSLDLATIEKDWHDGGALPEDAESVCIESKELVVHPSTVVILANNDFKSKKNREQMGDEIEELLNHMDDLKGSI